MKANYQGAQAHLVFSFIRCSDLTVLHNYEIRLQNAKRAALTLMVEGADGFLAHTNRLFTVLGYARQTGPPSVTRIKVYHMN